MYTVHNTHTTLQTYHAHTSYVHCTQHSHHTTDIPHTHPPIYTVHPTHTTLQAYCTHTHTHTPQASGVEPAQLPFLVPPCSSCVTCLRGWQTPSPCFPQLLPFKRRPCRRLRPQGCVRSCWGDTARECGRGWHLSSFPRHSSTHREWRVTQKERSGTREDGGGGKRTGRCVWQWGHLCPRAFLSLCILRVSPQHLVALEFCY